MKTYDVLIIGSGIAALQFATRLNKDLNVIILTKEKVRTANSYLAQGGIAAAIDADDDPSKHIADTLEAGRYHNDYQVVEEIVNRAPDLIKFISEQGDVFDRNDDGRLLLGMEGAHSEKRIVHGGGDATGKNVMEFLIDRIGENVTIEEHVFAYELLLNDEHRCIGVKAKKDSGTTMYYYSSNTVMATGGCGQLFTYTSNAETVNGDGIAMAYLAGAEIVDMEFIQFHPTLLYVNGETKGLISEAVRGEGAVLVTEDGTPIMKGIHPLKDLAPRHVVSQRIYEFLKNGHSVYLDISKIEKFEQRFPTITRICNLNGVRLSQGKIPVAPGSHFLMGGIKTDLTGRTSLEGLFAIGEAACTGLHGANRLASNSLLEGLYQGEKLALLINGMHQDLVVPKLKHSTKREKLTLPDIQQIKDLMMERVGIVRNEVDLQKQKAWLHHYLPDENIDLGGCSKEELTKIFMLFTAKLITEAALQRTESRGGHFRSDYPEEDQQWFKRRIHHQNIRGWEKDHEHIETALAT